MRRRSVCTQASGQVFPFCNIIFKFDSCQHILFSVIYEILHLVSVIVNVMGVNLSFGNFQEFNKICSIADFSTVLAVQFPVIFNSVSSAKKHTLFMLSSGVKRQLNQINK